MYNYTMSQKTKQNYFCHNFVKFPPTLIIFGTKMANSLELYEFTHFSLHLTHVNVLPC